ncbi:hypothetical protein NDU88_004640 [Pleurodeles waltl]|uniref:Uncharacterized protein n=1 Tax=Pleurodeles waltl TaxID=8319 RepID=A0AAV7T8P6_PLEWA|nr:hypothetical protein NDU88_004640 [Pleurodeles waltl]
MVTAGTPRPLHTRRCKDPPAATLEGEVETRDNTPPPRPPRDGVTSCFPSGARPLAAAGIDAAGPATAPFLSRCLRITHPVRAGRERRGAHKGGLGSQTPPGCPTAGLQLTREPGCATAQGRQHSTHNPTQSSAGTNLVGEQREITNYPGLQLVAVL